MHTLIFSAYQLFSIVRCKFYVHFVFFSPFFFFPLAWQWVQKKEHTIAGFAYCPEKKRSINAIAPKSCSVHIHLLSHSHFMSTTSAYVYIHIYALYSSLYRDTFSFRVIALFRKIVFWSRIPSAVLKHLRKRRGFKNTSDLFTAWIRFWHTFLIRGRVNPWLSIAFLFLLSNTENRE